jgi:hypothetical protein
MPRSAYEISLIALARTLVLLAATGGAAAAQLPQPEPTEAVGAASPRLPVFFVENRGQWAGEARYAGNTAGYAVAFHDDRVVLTRAGEKGNATVELAFVGGRARPQGEDPLRARVSYFVGEASSWRSNLESCAAVRYRGLWPGVDLRFYESAGALEYDVILAPGAELAPVEFEVVGAASLAVESDGALLLRTELGDLRQAAPRTWEVAEDGTQVRLRCDFDLRATSRYGFRANERDPRRTLVVDPVLMWGTYFRCSGFAPVIDVDAAGCVYLAGNTNGLLTTPGTYQPNNPGSTSGFIAKLDPSATGSAQLVWCTYLGGSGSENFHTLKIGPTGSITVGGFTTSTNFPTTIGALSRQFFSSRAGVVCTLAPNGDALQYSTFLSGTFGSDVDVDAVVPHANGTITVAILTDHPNIPTTAGAYQTSSAGGYDLWMARIDPARIGSAQLQWATYLGSPGSEWLGDIAVTQSDLDKITFCGRTNSGASLPRSHQSGTLGGTDMIIGQFDITRSGASQRTFLHVISGSTTSQDRADDLAIDASGAIHSIGNHGTTYRLISLSSDGSTITGNHQILSGLTSEGANAFLSENGILTASGFTSGAIVPITADAGQPTGMGQGDLWICQFDTTTSQVVYGSYLGGSGDDRSNRQSAAMHDNVLTLACSTRSLDLPLESPYLSSFTGAGPEFYVARLDLPHGRISEAGLAPRDVELLDLDTDGDLDVATANEGSDNLSLRTNDGAGTLSAERTIALTAADDAPIALARCDLDDDGARDDLAVACEASSTLVLVTNPSSASPTRISLSIAGQRASCVAAGDLDADPRDDVVVGREGLPFSGGAGLAVVRNGGAAVDLAIPAPHPSQIGRVALGDLDGDGDLDLAALARGGSDAVLLFAGDGAGALAFAGSLALTSSGLVSSLVLADLDGDGRNDLAAVQPALFPPTQTLRVFRRSSAGPLSPALFTLGADLATSGTLAIDLAVGDVEGDSIPTQLARLEFAHANAGDGSVTLRHGFTGSSFASSSSPTVGTNPVAVALGDLNGDGCDDLVVANQGSNDVSVLLSTPSPLAQSYGTSCGGPLLAAVGSPTLGNAAFAVELSGARAFSPVLFLFSSTSADIPLPPSACNLYLGAPLSSLLRFTNAGGQSVLQVGIPNWPALRGVDLHFQGAVFRSSGGAFEGALDLSDALRVQVGS